MADLELPDLAMQIAGTFRAGAHGTRRGMHYCSPDAKTQDLIADLFEACAKRIRELERQHPQHNSCASEK